MSHMFRRSSVLSVLLIAAVVMSLSVVTAVAKSAPPAKIVGPAGSQVQALLGKDMYESDDSTSTAKPATAWSRHTFHDGDEDDFMYFTAAKDEVFMFETLYLGDGLYDPYIYIEDATGSSLADNDDSDVWDSTYSSTVYWTAPDAGKYYIRVYNNGDDSSSYDLFFTRGNARRVWGTDRYTNAVAVSTLMWDNTNNGSYGSDYGPQDIFLANGMNYADASAAAALATQAEGVVLLTSGPTLNPATKAEISRLSESYYWDDEDVKVWILGGKSSIPSSVVNEIRGMRNITMVERIDGATRFDVAVRVAEITRDDDTEGSSVYLDNLAFICNSTAWADQLAVAPVAAWGEGVVLFTNKDGVPAQTMKFINDAGVTDVVVVGGTSSVGAGALAQLKAAVGASNVTVLDGANRYATAKKVAQWGVDEYGMDGNLCVLASGQVFPDALTAAPVTWWTEGPLLLTRGDVLSSEVTAFFDHNGGIDPGCYVVGGPNSIKPATMAKFQNLYKKYLP